MHARVDGDEPGTTYNPTNRTALEVQPDGAQRLVRAAARVIGCTEFELARSVGEVERMLVRALLDDARLKRDSTGAPPVKRADRGADAENTSASSDEAAPVRRGPGRPRKDAAASYAKHATLSRNTVLPETETTPPKRPRGRPRKDSQHPGGSTNATGPRSAVEALPRRPRGRPRKDDLARRRSGALDGEEAVHPPPRPRQPARAAVRPPVREFAVSSSDDDSDS